MTVTKLMLDLLRRLIRVSLSGSLRGARGVQATIPKPGAYTLGFMQWREDQRCIPHRFSWRHG